MEIPRATPQKFTAGQPCKIVECNLDGARALLHLAPLAGRGRILRIAKNPGEGDYPRFPMRREAPHPALSPQARGEGAHHRSVTIASRWPVRPSFARLRRAWRRFQRS